jgi:elongation factor G
MRVIRGLVPMNRMFGYSNLLRSMTQGRGTFTMEHASYTQVSDEDAERLTL